MSSNNNKKESFIFWFQKFYVSSKEKKKKKRMGSTKNVYRKSLLDCNEKNNLKFILNLSNMDLQT